MQEKLHHLEPIKISKNETENDIVTVNYHQRITEEKNILKILQRLAMNNKLKIKCFNGGINFEEHKTNDCFEFYQLPNKKLDFTKKIFNIQMYASAKTQIYAQNSHIATLKFFSAQKHREKCYITYIHQGRIFRNLINFYMIEYCLLYVSKCTKKVSHMLINSKAMLFQCEFIIKDEWRNKHEKNEQIKLIK